MIFDTSLRDFVSRDRINALVRQKVEPLPHLVVIYKEELF